MKLWQLDSILNANHNRNLSVIVAASKDEWSYLKIWFDEISMFYERGDKNVLDANLPSDFVGQVLEESGIVCYETKVWYKVDNSEGHWQTRLQSYSHSNEDKKIKAVDVYMQYGGDILENVFERSVVEVNTR